MKSCLIWLAGGRKGAVLMLCLLWSSVAGAQEPLPHFVSLRVGEVNVRAGPGMDYPIVRRYMRASVPLEIVAAVKEWRRVRDWDGKEGWVHRLMLNRQRYGYVKAARAIIRDGDDATAPIRLYVERGVFVKLLQCRKAWCFISVGRHEGWILRRSLWGVYPHEEIAAN